MSHPAPRRDEQQRAATDELFFSTTDRRGVVTSANNVFERVSGYSRAEIIGKPHNLVRHPDMPRIVFKTLWDEIGAGRPVAAYVKNRTIDGNYYWVIATALPIENGYLSIRMNPTTEHFAVAREVYGPLRELERSIEGPQGIDRKAGMEASGRALAETLAGTDYKTYDGFMRAALLAEVRAREARMQESGVRTRRARHTGSAVIQWDRAFAAVEEVNAFLRHLVMRLDNYIQLNQQLAGKAGFVRDLADEVRLFALNAIVASSKARGGNAAVGAVAELLSARSDVSGPMFNSLADSVSDASALLSELLFPVAATSLQGETLETFMHELAIECDGCARRGDLDALHACFGKGLRAMLESLTVFGRRLEALQPSVDSLRREMEIMRALSLNGRIEAARLDHGESFTMLFTTVSQRIETARQELDGLNKLGQALFAEDARRLPRVERANTDLTTLLKAA
ncbi:MAG: PAS domain-containing protein [Dehalococcoidia bacterium]|nr:PAS domain-containing protein [Dehalococcoidia bacterium]